MSLLQNMPALRFPEFSGEWEKKKLGNLLEFKNGINATKEQYGHGIKFINVLDILNNEFITYDRIIGSVDVDNDTVNRYPVSYGDILFQRSSETREEVGSACVYLDPETIATFGGFVIRGRKIGDYDPVFFNKLLKTDLARDAITSKSGGSTRYNVGQETLSSISLLFPTIPEQQKIATFLTAVDDKLTQLKKKKTMLEQYKKGVMQKIFSQDIRFKNDDGKNFPDWEKKKLGDVYSFRSTNSYSRDNLNYDNGEVKNIHYGDIHTKFQSLFDIRKEDVPFINQEISLGKFSSESYCRPGDLIIADASEDYADIGKCIEIKDVDDQKVIAGLHTLHARPEFNEISIGFGCYLMKSRDVRLQIMTIAQGTKVLSISAGRLSDISISVPCVQEQTKIANFLSAIDDKINHTTTRIEKNQQWKKGLLQQMFV
ncbi:MAG: restriction endonuclease subunit S [Bacteroidetes bacterium]|nr:restriction endonuclease subunit S [Bacteroidota bacterium]